MPLLFCPRHNDKRYLLEVVSEDPSVRQYICTSDLHGSSPCNGIVTQPIISTPLIELPFEDACQLKFQIGRAEHGPVFLNNPITEIDMEIIDAVNYAHEAIRQGYDAAAMTEIINDLKGVDKKVRSIFSATKK